MHFFLDDFENAKSRAAALDERIVSAASSISSNYSDLLAMSSRLTMAGYEITAPKSNESDIMIFMKDTGISR